MINKSNAIKIHLKMYKILIKGLICLPKQKMLNDIPITLAAGWYLLTPGS